MKYHEFADCDKGYLSTSKPVREGYSYNIIIILTV